MHRSGEGFLRVDANRDEGQQLKFRNEIAFSRAYFSLCTFTPPSSNLVLSATVASSNDHENLAAADEEMPQSAIANKVVRSRISIAGLM